MTHVRTRTTAGAVVAALALVIVALVPVAPHAQLKPDVALKAAIDKEVVDGDLKVAIEMYRPLAEQKADRAVAAKALMRMGQCYEKLGTAQTAESRKAYERLVRDFADQKDVADQARARLSALAPFTATPASPPGSLRRVYQATGVPAGVNGVTLSADARYAVIRLAEFVVRDLATGTERRVPYPPPDALAAEWRDAGPGRVDVVIASRALSPDGSQIAYEVSLTANTPGERRVQTQVRLVNVDGAGARLVTKQDDTWITLFRWTADGKSVLAKMESSDARTFEIISIRMSDGAVTRVSAAAIPASDDEPLTGYPSPDARFIVEWGGGTNTDGRSISVLDTRTGKRNRIADPIKGRYFQPGGWAPDGSGLLVMGSGAGEMAAWFVRLTDGVPQGAPQLLRTDTAQGVVAMGIGADGTYYFRSSTRAVKRYIAALDPATGRVNGTPVLMPEMQVACGYDWSPDSTAIAFGAKMSKGVTDQNEPCTLLVIRPLADGHERVLSPGLSDIDRPRWSPNGKSLVVAGQKDGIYGDYRIDLDAGSARLLVESPANRRYGIPTADWTPDGKGLILGRADRNSDGASVNHRIVHRDLETGRETSLYAIERPGSIYFTSSSVSREGYVSALVRDTDDSLAAVVIPPDGGPARVVFRTSAKPALGRLPTTSLALGGGVSWSADGKALYLAQSTPGTGWFPRKLLRVPIDGGSAVDAGLSLPEMNDVQPSPDGKRLLLSANETQVEIWAIDRLVPTKAAAAAATPRK